MRVTLIYNPNAGDNQQLGEDDLVGLIRKAGHTVCQSSEDKELDQALENPDEIVVVAGGDGTVGKVATTLIGKAVTIAVIPMGTANNIATTLGIINRPIEELIAEWTSSHPIQFDVGEANGPWGSMCFIEGFGVGLFTETMSRLHAGKSLTHLDNRQIKITSVVQMLKGQIRNYPAKNLKMTLDGQDVSGAYILLEALNLKYIGPNLHLAPGADPSDGFLDIVFVAEDERDQLVGYLSDWTENNLFEPGWTIRKGRHLHIEWNGFSAHIDDKAWPVKEASIPSSPAIIDVQANRYTVKFLVPG
jgi:diacylglycerol kinase (ATP)